MPHTDHFGPFHILMTLTNISGSGASGFTDYL